MTDRPLATDATSGPSDGDAADGDARDGDARDGVAAVVAVGGLLLVVADFDGTLADYHPDPMAATIAPGARPAIRRLARLASVSPDRVAVVILSGRVARDVASRVRVGGVRYLGNHGNERGLLARGRPAERLRVELPPALERSIGAATALGDAVAAAVARRAGMAEPPAWLFVERKGPAVSFHYRGATDRDAAGRLLDGAIAEASAAGLTDGFSRIDSRLIIEFQPPGAGAKGTAVERLLTMLHPRAAVVLGDDAPDAEAFVAVHGARDAGRLAASLTVAVAHDRPLPTELLASADLVVAGTRGAAAVLRRLAVALEAEAGRSRR